MSSSTKFYCYILNPVMRCLLRSPLHGITSHNIGIVHFTGHKSGRFIRALPRDAKVYGLSLAADGEVVEASLATIAGQLMLVDIRLDD